MSFSYESGGAISFAGAEGNRNFLGERSRFSDPILPQ